MGSFSSLRTEDTISQKLQLSEFASTFVGFTLNFVGLSYLLSTGIPLQICRAFADSGRLCWYFLQNERELRTQNQDLTDSPGTA
jgi:hypothetical protein